MYILMTVQAINEEQVQKLSIEDERSHSFQYRRLRMLAFLLFLTAATKLLRFSANKIGLLWFLPLALALSLLSTLM